MALRRAAFFDIDDTLIKGSTGGYLIRHLYRQREIRLGSVLRLAYYVALYRSNRMRQVEVYRWGYGLCGNRTLAQLREILDGAFDRYVRRRVYRDGLALLERHRRRGDLVVAISGAPDYMVARVSALLGIEHYIATQTPMNGDRVTNDVREPLCYGAGKVAFARAFAAAHAIDLGASYFYSDSASDLPLLEQVGHPIAVNPQRLLRRHALRRGWPILQFSCFSPDSELASGGAQT